MCKRIISFLKHTNCAPPGDRQKQQLDPPQNLFDHSMRLSDSTDVSAKELELWESNVLPPHYMGQGPMRPEEQNIRWGVCSLKIKSAHLFVP